MPKFDQPLNKDLNDILTSARWDTGATTWLHDSAMFVKNAGGVFVPVGPTNPMPAALMSSNITYVTPTHTLLGVTNASQQALAANTNRRYAVLQNDSVNDIYLFLGAGPAVANKGIRLNAGGGSYELRSADGSLYTGAVYAIAAVAGPSILLITEGV